MASVSRSSQLLAILLAVVLLCAVSGVDAKKKPGGKKPGGKKPTAEPATKVVDAAAAGVLLDAGNTTFVDVRTAELYDAAHVPGSVNIAFNLVRQSINIGKPKPPPTSKDILCVAESTDKGSQACTYYYTSNKYDYVKLYVLKGGFTAWEDAGYGTEAADAKAV